MAGPAVFNVAFGLNETKLTQALEKRSFEEAELIIRNNLHPTYLDEGCYQRTPLYIVLCGKSQEGGQAPRNLHLAKMLTEHGANVNYRIPATYFGAEFMDPGQSAIELVTDFYNEITQQHSWHDSQLLSDEESPHHGWSSSTSLVIGLNKLRITDQDDCLEQLLDLLMIMLGQGGDLNIRDWYGMTPLHRTVVFSQDLRLAQLLCEWGSDINAQDLLGNTSLGSFCDAFPMGNTWTIDDEDCDDDYLFATNYYDKAILQLGKTHFLKFLLSQKGIKLDMQKKSGRTALFNAVVRGDGISAEHLLAAGSDPTIRGEVITGYKETRKFSPLFASLCSLRVCEQLPGQNQIPTSHFYMAHLVDKGYFTKTEITQELLEYIDSDLPTYKSLKLFGPDIIPLIFGGTSASLRQLASRAVLNNHLSNNLHNFGFEGLDNVSVNESLLLNLPKFIVQQCSLPRGALLHFQIEIFRLQLFNKFAKYQWLHVEDIKDLGDSDDSTSTENDSDLEYW